jgi:hypothetical protein
MNWNVYLSGEIHSDWRQQLVDGARELDLPVIFTSAVTDHQASDAAGDLLGVESSNFWRDHKSSKVNAIRTKTNSGTRHLMPGIVQPSASRISRFMMRTSSTRSKKWMPPLWLGLQLHRKSLRYSTMSLALNNIAPAMKQVPLLAESGQQKC